jgi:hypothetical protein
VSVRAARLDARREGGREGERARERGGRKRGGGERERERGERERHALTGWQIKSACEIGHGADGRKHFFYCC